MGWISTAFGVGGTLLGTIVGKNGSSAGMSGGSDIGAGLIEVGTKKDINNTSTTNTNTTTTTYSPYTSNITTPTYNLDYIYNISSPNSNISTKKEGSTNTPSQQVVPSVSVTPSTSIGSGTTQPTSALSSLTDNLSTIVVLGAIGIGLYMILGHKKK